MKAKAKPAPRARKIPASAPTKTATASERGRCPIVGIGASAGGLEAIEQFLQGVPPGSGLAFVVVQHLDPTRKGMMVELLRRATALRVIQITDRLRIEPNRVYVIPPNRDLSVLNGVLHLLEPAAPRGLRLPIDFFFCSLAADQRERSIGVILSGMGSDGARGLRAIKDKAGAVFVQTPESAKFDGMPLGAANSGLADAVAPAEELAGKILAYLEHEPRSTTRTEPDLTDSDQSGLEKIVLLLRTHTGHDFSHYKKSTIYRRIERRMRLHQLEKIADYVRYLRENAAEARLLFKELLIGVTGFFRDPAVWEQFKTEAIPALLAAHPEGGTLRAWVPACSTGEEAYTLAMIFREALDATKPAAHYALQVFATDLDKEAIDQARKGFYPATIAADVAEGRLRRFFAQQGRGYSVIKEIRKMVIFAPQNLVMDPPFTKLDCVTCRNLLIYLEADLQKKILPLFYYSLNPGGVLVLGMAETAGASADLFIPMPGKNRIYRRSDVAPRPGISEFPAALPRSSRITAPVVEGRAARAEPNIAALTEALVLRRFAPAAVLTTAQGDVVYVSGKTGHYLEPAVGKANLNLFAMAREGLAGVLNEAFARAGRAKDAVELHEVKVGGDDGAKIVNVTVQRLDEPAALRGMMLVVFTDVARPPPAPGRGQKTRRATAHGQQLGVLQREVRRAREELTTAREEMQSAHEELKSANEEMQSTNEELQSTNGELTTSKEEMQSMNEELQTVNHELTSKVEELTEAGDDMKNLLNSTEIATLFLDRNLRVRRFTTQATSIIKLIPGDIGRPITDLVSALVYPRLEADATEVLTSLESHEAEVPARDGRCFVVRILPYHTQDNRIDGVVITFVDTSVAKAVEAKLREAQAVLETRFTDQTTELDLARKLEGVLEQAHAVLQKRFASQTSDLRRSQAALVSARKSSAP